MDKKTFDKNIFELFEISKLPMDEQEETINRIGGIIFQSVLLRVLPTLEEKSLKEYENLMDEKAEPEKVFDFLFEKIPDFLRIITEESENFRKETAEALG